jgi:hypothetical protein
MSSCGFICLACGQELPERLRWTASLRCQSCRESNAPLNIEFGRLERALRLSRARSSDEQTAA